MRVRVKVCGITRAEDARLAADLGVDAVGFVFWPGSPRALSVERAAGLARLLPPLVTVVGVFVNQPIDEIRRVAEAVGLGAVQLHGDEPADVWTSVPCRCIKAVAVGEGFNPAFLADWPVGVMPLLDAVDAQRRGGTGRAVDWRAASAASRVRPVLLAGGLTPGNVAAAIRQVQPYGVDVSSGVETEPGIKDASRLRAFVDAVARAGTVGES